MTIRSKACGTVTMKGGALSSVPIRLWRSLKRKKEREKERERKREREREREREKKEKSTISESYVSEEVLSSQVHSLSDIRWLIQTG